MECETARNVMMEYLDGKPVDRGALEAHLSRCAECREAWERLARVEQLLREAPTVSAPMGFVGRTLAHLDRKRRIRRAVLGGLVLTTVAVGGGILGLGATVWGLSDLFEALGPLLRATLTLAPRLADVARTLLRSLCLTADALTAWLLLLAGCGLVAAIGANWIWWWVVRRVQAATISHP
ncbi:MAG TPA: hypothetical protein G4O00_14540 [Thermoflexia bacterium]|jgi:predicted anti-sigma-YlaC factor YlaD|nr:hypothetical protein [Thermoflexia bacterium]